MKLLAQGWSESTCKLYDFVLTEIGDNESEVLRGFKSGYFHPAKVIFVDAESSGLGTRSDFRYAGSSELRITTFRSQSSPGSHIALQKAERSRIIMAYMAFSGHDSEQPVNPSDVHLVINSVPAFIHTAMPDGYLDFFNETSLTYMGRSLEDVQGWKWISSIHPDDVEGIVAKWRASLASGELFLYEARVQRADGEYRWMLHHKVPRRDTNGIIIKWYGSSIDIEDRKRAEKKIRNEGLMINTIPVLAWACRPDGAAYFLNQRWLDYTGFSLEQGCGWGWKSALHPDDVEHLLTMWQGLLDSGEPREVSARIRRFDGEYRWFIFQARPVRDNRGKVVTWYGTNADIEDRRRAEEELRRSESQGCEPVATCS